MKRLLDQENRNQQMTDPYLKINVRQLYIQSGGNLCCILKHTVANICPHLIKIQYLPLLFLTIHIRMLSKLSNQAEEIRNFSKIFIYMYIFYLVLEVAGTMRSIYAQISINIVCVKLRFMCDVVMRELLKVTCGRTQLSDNFGVSTAIHLLFVNGSLV